MSRKCFWRSDLQMLELEVNRRCAFPLFIFFVEPVEILENRGSVPFNETAGDLPFSDN